MSVSKIAAGFSGRGQQVASTPGHGPPSKPGASRLDLVLHPGSLAIARLFPGATPFMELSLAGRWDTLIREVLIERMPKPLPCRHRTVRPCVYTAGLQKLPPSR